MDKQALFKTGMMGFNKTEVLTYIDEISSSSKEMEKKLGEKIAELEISNQKLGDEIATATQKIEDAQGRLEQEQARVKDLTAQLSEVSMEMAKYKRLSEEKEREIKIQREQNRQLQFRAESAEYKSKKYDDMSQQIGDALIDAKEKAQQMIQQANVQAKGILHNATTTMENFSGQMAYLKEDVAKAREILAKTLEQMNEKLDGVDSMIDKLSARVTLSGASVDEPDLENVIEKTQESTGQVKDNNFFRDAALQ